MRAKGIPLLFDRPSEMPDQGARARIVEQQGLAAAGVPQRGLKPIQRKLHRKSISVVY